MKKIEWEAKTRIKSL